MRHEVTSFNTKKTLADSLKKSMETKSLSKITVSEIIKDCGINRKTFYYHFEDMNALIKWMLEQESVEIVKKFDLMVDHKEVILFVINYVEENQYMLNNICDSVGSQQLKNFFFSDFIQMAESLILEVADRMNMEVEKNFLEFLSKFYAEAIARMVMDFFQNPASLNREDIIQNISLIFKASLPNILQAKHDGYVTTPF